jgi:hypothetical protein
VKYEKRFQGVKILGLLEGDLFLNGWYRAENNPPAVDRF